MDEILIKRRKILETDLAHLAIEIQQKTVLLKKMEQEYRQLTHLQDRENVLAEANNNMAKEFDKKNKYGFPTKPGPVR